MPHLNATGGLNILGFSQLTMLVQDEFSNGVPVAFCITGSETADIKKLKVVKQHWVVFTLLQTLHQDAHRVNITPG